MHASAALLDDEARKKMLTQYQVYYTAKSVGMQHIFVTSDKLFL